MSNARFFSALALTALATALVVGGLTMSTAAHADTPRTAICRAIMESQDGKHTEAWMNEMLASGRTSFVVAGGATAAPLCAW